MRGEKRLLLISLFSFLQKGVFSLWKKFFYVGVLTLISAVFLTGCGFTVSSDKDESNKNDENGTSLPQDDDYELNLTDYQVLDPSDVLESKLMMHLKNYK